MIWFDKLPSFTDSVEQQRTYLFCWSPAGISFCHSMYIVFCSSFPKEGFLQTFSTPAPFSPPAEIVVAKSVVMGWGAPCSWKLPKALIWLFAGAITPTGWHSCLCVFHGRSLGESLVIILYFSARAEAGPLMHDEIYCLVRQADKMLSRLLGPL